MNNPHQHCYQDIVELTDKFNEWKRKHGLVLATEQDLELEIRRCSDSNVHFLRRTLMMSVMDYRHLDQSKLMINVEDEWTLPHKMKLLSIEHDNVSQLKPDMTISFRTRSFCSDRVPIPDSLKAAFHPNGDINRCFPFLFVEAGDSKERIEKAFLSNLYTSSQALYNIFNWMARSGHQERFYSKVRVFSMVVTAQEIGVRIHRAAPRSGSRAAWTGRAK